MASFTKTYKDVIKSLQKNEAAKHVDDSEEMQAHYADYMAEVAHTSLAPIEAVYWYKKAKEANHIYNLATFKPTSDSKNRTDPYAELLGESSWLTEFCSEKAPTEDFLTGFYLAKAFLYPGGILVAGMTSFHVGFAKKQLIRGIECCIKKQTTYKKAWTQLGADIAHKRPEYLNGMNGSGDLSNINVVKSIRNQIAQALPGKRKLAFYICDVAVKSIRQLYHSMIIALTDVELKGMSIIRLPDMHDWATKVGSAQLLNVLLLVVPYFDSAKIFKTPWGTRPRYYLVMSGQKQHLDNRTYTSLIKFLEYDIDKILLFDKIIFTDDSVIYEGTSELVMKINDAYMKLVQDQSEMSCQDANALWLDHVFAKTPDKDPDDSDECSDDDQEVEELLSKLK